MFYFKNYILENKQLVVQDSISDCQGLLSFNSYQRSFFFRYFYNDPIRTQNKTLFFNEYQTHFKESKLMPIHFFTSLSDCSKKQENIKSSQIYNQFEIFSKKNEMGNYLPKLGFKIEMIEKSPNETKKFKKLHEFNEQNNGPKHYKTKKLPLTFVKTFSSKTCINQVPFLTFKNTSNLFSNQLLNITLKGSVDVKNSMGGVATGFFKTQNCNHFLNKINIYGIVSKSLIKLKKHTKKNKQSLLLLYFLSRIVKTSKNLPYSLIIIYTNLYHRFYLYLFHYYKTINGGSISQIINKKSNLEYWRFTQKKHNKNSRSWVLRKYWLKLEFFYKFNKQKQSSLVTYFAKSKKNYFYKNLLINRVLTKLNLVQLVILTKTFSIKQSSPWNQKRINILNYIYPFLKHEPYVVSVGGELFRQAFVQEHQVK